MSEEEKKTTRGVTRVALRFQSEHVLRNWMEQIGATYPNFSPTERNLVEWAIERLPSL